METKTNWKQFECVFSELPKTLINRVRQRIEEGDEGERVKHISKKIEQDGSFNSLMLDEMAKVYGILGMMYETIEDGMSEEDFIKLYCKD